ncbi:MAG: adenylate/guanylate cyclase domain-containing protein [Acidimicrobiia bacterium]|nr:adenylate/guanylate cyclase domain-containing protein [Acidimicrobiia bacterium]
MAEPDELTTFERGEERIVQIGELSFTRTMLEPGWHWKKHVAPIAGATSCQFPHFLLVAAGHLRLVMDDGTVYDLHPGDVVDVPPGHDSEVLGDEIVILYSPSGKRDWARPPAPEERLLTTLLFTDVVDSTALAEQLGDARWKALLSSYLRSTRLQLDRFRGHQVATTGDGILARFDSPGRAVRCARALVEAAAGYDLRIRAGVHTGEVELVAGDVRGLAVHIASRVMALAAPGEVLVTDTSRQLASGSGLVFEDRGEHRLKGVTEPRRIHAFLEAEDP